MLEEGYGSNSPLAGIPMHRASYERDCDVGMEPNQETDPKQVAVPPFDLTPLSWIHSLSSPKRPLSTNSPFHPIWSYYALTVHSRLTELPNPHLLSCPPRPTHLPNATPSDHLVGSQLHCLCTSRRPVTRSQESLPPSNLQPPTSHLPPPASNLPPPAARMHQDRAMVHGMESPWRISNLLSEVHEEWKGSIARPFVQSYCRAI
jgi:hypothetical protein